MPRDPSNDDDIVRVILKAAIAECGLPVDVAIRLDRAIRDSHGGSRYYVRKSPLRVVILRDRTHPS
jgi:hypothetical protein